MTTMPLVAAWRGPDTIMLDDAGLVVLPAFVDTHKSLDAGGP